MESLAYEAIRKRKLVTISQGNVGAPSAHMGNRKGRGYGQRQVQGREDEAVPRPYTFMDLPEITLMVSRTSSPPRLTIHAQRGSLDPSRTLLLQTDRFEKPRNLVDGKNKRRSRSLSLRRD